MKRLLLVIGLATFACATSAQPVKTYKPPKIKSYAPVVHRGYVKKNGTHVQPHFQSAPDGTKANNWSSKPNVNPFTGKAGTANAFPKGTKP